MNTTYQKLKVMREKGGLRQGTIADYLGVTQTYISRIETGERNLTVNQLESLASLYGYSLDSFERMEEVHPIQFASCVQSVTQSDLNAIAEIGKIAMNSRFMEKILEEPHIE